MPADRRAEVEAQLFAGEAVLAWFAPDLDRRLNFAEGLVVLTSRRLLALDTGEDAPAGTDKPAPHAWRSWSLDDVASLECRDRGGLGTLEAHGPRERLAEWRYTIGRATEAHHLVQQLEAYRRGERPEDEGWDEVEVPETAVPEGAASTRALFRLLRFAKPHLRLIAVGFLLTLAATAANQVPPYLTAPLLNEVLVPYQTDYDQIVARDDLDQQVKDARIAELRTVKKRELVWYLALFGIAAVVAWLLSWVQGIVMAWVGEYIGADLRNTTYAHLQRLSLEFFGRKRTGDLISRISNDTERICNFLSDNVLDFITDVVMIVTTAGILIWFDPWLALATLSPFPVIVWLIYRVRSQLTHGFHRGGRAWAAMTSILADTIPGIRVVKAFAQEQREIERFRRSNEQVVEANNRVNTVWTFFWPLVVLLNQIGLLIVWAAGAWRVFDGSINVGVLTASFIYVSRIYVRVESMTRMFSITQRAAVGAQRLFEILDRAPSVAEPLHPVHPGQLRGEVEFRGASFRYGNRSVLEDVNLKIAPNEMVGLVGPSGAGKSTLVNLVCRFYDVSEGAILVDGVDIRSFPVEEYRRHIGIVLQDPFLFYGTIAENIAYGRPSATRDEIITAARAARAHEFILRLPLGYDSLVGERGQSLSGGERQRISIARALLIDPRILILDEATSSVDTETEREIQAALDNLVKGRTTIAIAHRLSTLRRADRLVVLERGRVVEVGQHQELLETGGVYARLHQAQAEMHQMSE